MVLRNSCKDFTIYVLQVFHTMMLLFRSNWDQTSPFGILERPYCPNWMNETKHSGIEDQKATQ